MSPPVCLHPLWLEFAPSKRGVVSARLKKNALYLSVKVFSMKVLIGDTIWSAIFSGHPSHVKVYPFAGQSEYLHFSVVLRP